jgi:hypothetical protein
MAHCDGIEGLNVGSRSLSSNITVASSVVGVEEAGDHALMSNCVELSEADLVMYYCLTRYSAP